MFTWVLSSQWIISHLNEKKLIKNVSWKLDYYGKLVETFHNVSECKTVVYFGWYLTLQFLWPGDLDCWSFGIALLLTDSELHLATETEQNRMRLSLLHLHVKILVVFVIKQLCSRKTILYNSHLFIPSLILTNHNTPSPSFASVKSRKKKVINQRQREHFTSRQKRTPITGGGNIRPAGHILPAKAKFQL